MSVLATTISAHCFNKDGSLVAFSPNTNEVYIYEVKGENLKDWKRIHTLSEHFMTITDIDWNHTTNEIATSGQDRNAYVWKYDKNEWKPTLVILRIGRSATSIKWSPNGKKFAVGSGSKQIPVCHYEGSQDMWVAKTIKKGPKSTILSVDWTPNSLFLISGGCDFKTRIHCAYIKEVDDKTVDEKYTKLWGEKNCLSFGEVLTEFDQSRGWVEACRFSLNGNRFAFCGHDSTVIFGDLTNTDNNNVQTILRRDLPLKTICFLTDDLAVGGGYDNVPIIYEYNTKDNRWQEKGPLDTGKYKKADTGNKKNEQFSSVKNVFQQKDTLGKAQDGNQALLSRHQNVINNIIRHSDTKFTTSSNDGTILFWDIKGSY